MTDCSICWEPMIDEPLLKCLHRFHSKCLHTLKQCPLCRRRIEKIENHNIVKFERALLKREHGEMSLECELKNASKLEGEFGKMVQKTIENELYPKFKRTSLSGHLVYKQYTQNFEEKLEREGNALRLQNYIFEKISRERHEREIARERTLIW